MVEKTKIIPLSIGQFVDFIKTGVQNEFKNSEKLKKWFETQWALNQDCEDEQAWYKSIQMSVLKWAS